jgi:hypothetical protein
MATKKAPNTRTKTSTRSSPTASTEDAKTKASATAAAEVSAFIATLEAKWRAPFAALRAGLLAYSEVTEHIKWKAPSFCHAGDDRVTVRVQPKGGLQLIFHRGVAVKDTRGFAFADPSGLMVWAAPDRGVVTFRSPEDLHEQTPAVVTLARAWMDATRDA